MSPEPSKPRTIRSVRGPWRELFDEAKLIGGIAPEIGKFAAWCECQSRLPDDISDHDFNDYLAHRLASDAYRQLPKYQRCVVSRTRRAWNLVIQESHRQEIRELTQVTDYAPTTNFYFKHGRIENRPLLEDIDCFLGKLARQPESAHLSTSSLQYYRNVLITLGKALADASDNREVPTSVQQLLTPSSVGAR